MRLTALPPPPPTPMTLMRAPRTLFVVILNAHFSGFVFRCSIAASASSSLSEFLLETCCKNGAQLGAQAVVFRRARHARAMGV